MSYYIADAVTTTETNSWIGKSRALHDQEVYFVTNISDSHKSMIGSNLAPIDKHWFVLYES